MTSDSEWFCKSSIISVILPKHANPAFLVLAPEGRDPFSKIKILDFGNFSFNLNAQFSPTIPLPTIV